MHTQHKYYIMSKNDDLRLYSTLYFHNYIESYFCNEKLENVEWIYSTAACLLEI